MSTTSRTVTTRRRGRPRSENPRSDKRSICLTEAEGRMLNAWMKERGIAVDNEAFRLIVLERLVSDGTTDPGPNSEKGQPTTSPYRPNPEPVLPHEPKQLALTA